MLSHFGHGGMKTNSNTTYEGSKSSLYRLICIIPNTCPTNLQENRNQDIKPSSHGASHPAVSRYASPDLLTAYREVALFWTLSINLGYCKFGHLIWGFAFIGAVDGMIWSISLGPGTPPGVQNKTASIPRLRSEYEAKPRTKVVASA